MNQLYNAGREKFATGQIDWISNNFSILLLDENYVFDEAHTTLADTNASSRVGGLQRINGKSVTDGYLDGASVQYLGLAHNIAVTAVVIVKEAATEDQAELVAYYDTIDGLPWTPTGDNYTVFPDALFGGYFRL